MAPEQWREAPQDTRTDVFGAAAVLAEMVTGQLPYRATEDWSAVLERGARPRVDAPGAPPGLVRLLRRGLSASPEGRPRDGNAWLAALLEVHERLDSAQLVAASRVGPRPAARPGAGSRPRAPGRRRPGALVASLAVAAAIAIGAAAYVLLS
jgi:serine/threonine protein kinase